MDHISFDWDKEKNLANQKKHGISFEEAQSVFVDENALLIHDPDHSGDEDRFILLGLSSSIHLMVVCHCYRGKMMLFESSLLEKQLAQKKNVIGKGDKYEKRIRFFQGSKEPLCQQAQASSNSSDG